MYGMKTIKADPAVLKNMQILDRIVNHIDQEIIFRAACDGYDNSEISAEYNGMIAGTGFYDMNDFFLQSDYMPVFDEEAGVFACRFEYDCRHYQDGKGIVRAAVMFPDGTIVRGFSHNDCYEEARRRELPCMKCRRHEEDCKEGFITMDNRFVGRYEAMQIARDNGQLKESYKEDKGDLFSFMLVFPDIRRKK